MNKILLLIPLLFIVSSSMAFSSSIDSPKHQLESGIAPENIICKENLVLTIRTNGQPACVTERTADKLNWKIMSNNIPKEFTKSITSESDTTTELTIPITNKMNVSTEISKERILTKFERSAELSAIRSSCINWPVFSIDTPSQVTIGTEFDVILDYTFVIPDIDAGYEDPDAIMGQELFTACNIGNIYLIYPEHAEIVDAGYVHYITRIDDNWDPPLVINSGKIAYSFDNTAPQSKTITMKINEPSPFDDKSFFDISMDANNVRRYISINGDVVTLSENVPPQPLSAISSSLSVDTSFTKTWVGDYANKTGTVKLVNRNQLPQNEPPVELFADFLKEYYPDKNYEEFILSFNFTESYVEIFFEANPDMRN